MIWCDKSYWKVWKLAINMPAQSRFPFYGVGLPLWLQVLIIEVNTVPGMTPSTVLIHQVLRPTFFIHTFKLTRTNVMIHLNLKQIQNHQKCFLGIDINSLNFRFLCLGTCGGVSNVSSRFLPLPTWSRIREVYVICSAVKSLHSVRRVCGFFCFSFSISPLCVTI